MAFPTRIYLTGFMGSGKSTIGPILANVLGYHFVDLDAVIAEQVGRPVPRFFEEAGEAAFRAVEAEVLRETGGRERVVVAVGGGALANEANLQWALAEGTVVYLHVPVEALVRRLRKGRTVRPLLLDDAGRVLATPDLRAKVEAIMQRREPFYRRAHLVVEVARQPVGPTVDQVVRALRRAGRPSAG